MPPSEQNDCVERSLGKKYNGIRQIEESWFGFSKAPLGMAYADLSTHDDQNNTIQLVPIRYQNLPVSADTVVQAPRRLKGLTSSCVNLMAIGQKWTESCEIHVHSWTTELFLSKENRQKMEKKTSAGASASGANPTEVWEGRERWWWSDEGKQWTRSDEIDPKLINRCAL